MILDATCAPQNIRFPTDTSLLNEAREKAEEIIDELHGMGLSEGEKPRTYRLKARWKYNSFSKARKKTAKMIRTTIRQQLGYLKRDLGIIDAYERLHRPFGNVCLLSWIPVFQVLWISIARLAGFVRARDY